MSKSRRYEYQPEKNPFLFLNDSLLHLQYHRSLKLDKSEKLSRSLYENANDAIFLMDSDRFIDCNQKTLQIYGCTRRHVIGNHPYDPFFTPSIQPDGLLTKDNMTVAIEIEKSNKKTIWFDIIKIMMLVQQRAADFGLLMVPRNYAYRLGEWDLFKEARFYRWCLLRFAKVGPDLLSKLAILGYTQEVRIVSNWLRLDSATLTDIKGQARQYFSNRSHA